VSSLCSLIFFGLLNAFPLSYIGFCFGGPFFLVFVFVFSLPYIYFWLGGIMAESCGYFQLRQELSTLC